MRKDIENGVFRKRNFLINPPYNGQVEVEVIHEYEPEYHDQYFYWNKKDLEDLKSWCEKAIDKMSSKKTLCGQKWLDTGKP
jgi:hypothetical protein